MKSSRWTMVFVGAIAFLVLATMVRASPRTAPSTVPIDAQNANRVDNHHAGPSSGTKAQRKNRVLWANAAGKLSTKALPMTKLNKRYLNDDQPETIKAAVAGSLLTVNNTGTGGFVYGIYAYGEDGDLYGQSTSGVAVQGQSSSNIGVFAVSGTGTGMRSNSTSGTSAYVYSGSSLPLKVAGYSGTNLIEAWDHYSAQNLRFRVTRSGHVYADGTFHGGGADFAEMMATSEGVTYEPGDLLIVGPDGKPFPSSAPNTTNLLGVYSTNPAFVGGTGDDEDTEGKIPVAITGIVPLKVSAENGAILPGDLLTSSSIPGHAMRASPVTIDSVTFYLPGTILGKALEPLEEGKGVILVLVTLQ